MVVQIKLWGLVALLVLFSSACTVQFPFYNNAEDDLEHSMATNAGVIEPEMLDDKVEGKVENNTDTRNAAENNMSQNSLNKAHTNSDIIDTQACPAKFYDVKIPRSGKLCQVFATELPASMILFVAQQPEDLLSFYTNDTAQFGPSKLVKQRYVLHSKDQTSTVIISKDGDGSQIDILVVAPK